MYFPVRKLRLQRRRIARKGRKLIKLALIAFFLWLIYSLVTSSHIKLQSPILFKPVGIVKQLPKEANKNIRLESTPHGAVLKSATSGAEIKIQTRILQGIASYYSRAGCLGCNENLIMANGQELDDTALTIALTPEVVSEHNLINGIVEVKNLQTGDAVEAKVTDTGGFARHGRVADLSVATRNAINCTNLCQVLIYY